jgi:hypothetical protein
MSENGLTVQDSTTRSVGLALSSFDDAWRFAQIAAKTDFAPKDFRGKPESCLLAIQHGAEIGLSPMQSLQQIAVINGRPSVWGDAALALCYAAPCCEWVKEKIEGDGDNAIATCECKRKGDPETKRATFSVADAKKSGLWGKTGPWTQYPKRMLQLRARGFALRDAFPDVLRGLVTAEEARDYTDATPRETVTVSQPKPAAEPAAEPGMSPSEMAEAFASEAIAEAETIEALEVVRERIGKSTKLDDAAKERMKAKCLAKAEKLMEVAQ